MDTQDDTGLVGTLGGVLTACEHLALTGWWRLDETATDVLALADLASDERERCPVCHRPWDTDSADKDDGSLGILHNESQPAKNGEQDMAHQPRAAQSQPPYVHLWRAFAKPVAASRDERGVAVGRSVCKVVILGSTTGGLSTRGHGARSNTAGSHRPGSHGSGGLLIGVFVARSDNEWQNDTRCECREGKNEQREVPTLVPFSYSASSAASVMYGFSARYGCT